MNLLPTPRKHAAALAAAGAGVLLFTVHGSPPAAAQAATPSGTAAHEAPPASAAQAPAGATPAPAEITGDVQRGHRKAATCLGCHAIPGYKAGFPIVYRVPMIGGQNAKYIENALKEYQKGERRFPSMMATAKSLSDQDIADVAAYFASQR